MTRRASAPRALPTAPSMAPRSGSPSAALGPRDREDRSAARGQRSPPGSPQRRARGRQGLDGLCQRLPHRRRRDSRTASPPKARSLPAGGRRDPRGAKPGGCSICRAIEGRAAGGITGGAADAGARRCSSATPGSRKAMPPSTTRISILAARRSAGDAGHRALGAVQARRRHRPYPGGRGPGHQPRAMGDHRGAGRGVLRRRGRPAGASAPAHGLRRGRREAIDLLLPGRRSRGLRRHAPAFRPAARGLGRLLEEVPLTISFRSTEAVLDAVDAVFAQAPAQAGVSLDGRPIAHRRHALGQAGHVELWPLAEPQPARAEARWRPPRRTPRRRFAARAAGAADRAADQGDDGRRRDCWRPAAGRCAPAIS